ncbi:hypothetical protein [Pelomonas sp. SE-A7]|uniref:hypothetical protein n=1 Tax=Pelomonas sp. SE-A7 TaxID=3054953 RepID=UPI00259D161F|nr:hypothetical protein [Pelomonas sp. SE-A7]MDM4767957.1 hypothetical protein [Pelomonas sp. SE-A7]
MPQFTSPRANGLRLNKPRNPLVGPALMRQAGRHGSGAQRQQAQQRLHQELKLLGQPDRSP